MALGQQFVVVIVAKSAPSSSGSMTSRTQTPRHSIHDGITVYNAQLRPTSVNTEQASLAPFQCVDAPASTGGIPSGPGTCLACRSHDQLRGNAQVSDALVLGRWWSRWLTLPRASRTPSACPIGQSARDG